MARRSAVVGAPLTEARSIRLWGRRRLLTLERLIALATRVRVHLLGSGLPSFWVVEMGDITVTLGLSGWTANDWSQAGRFDLLQTRHEVSDLAKQRVAQALQSAWLATPAELAERTGLAQADVQAALTLWVQAGRAVFDLPSGRFAWRELSREPLPLDSLRFASPEEEQALAHVHARRARLTEVTEHGERIRLGGSVKDGRHSHEPTLLLNRDRQIQEGTCQCNFFTQNRLRRGPCSHMLSVLLLAQAKLTAAPAKEVA